MSNEQDPSKTGQQQAAANGADDDSRPVTMADLKALLSTHAAETSKTVNAAVTSHTKRLAKDWEGRLAALAPKPAEGEGGADAEGDEPGKVVTAAKPAKAAEAQPAKPIDPELAALRKQLAKIERDAEAAKAEAAKERRQRIEANGYSALGTALRGKVAAGAEALALDVLRARGHVAIDEAGAVRLRLGSKDEPEEGLDLDSGVAAFLKTKEAAFLLPAPNSGAAGGKNARPLAALGTSPGSRAGASSNEDVDEAFRRVTGKSIGDVLG